jgi:rhamnosyltransferase
LGRNEEPAVTNRRILATIAILTFNGEKDIDEILAKVSEQKLDDEFEVLVIDSGSTDQTLDIIKKHKKVILHEIPNSEFGHGKTRQLAAKLAKGEFVVYLTHDAIPATESWLYEMLRPFEMNPKIVGVLGRQQPRLGCIPLIKYDIIGVFKGFGPQFGTTIFYKDTFIDSQSVYDAVAFYSDSNSAARKSALLGEIPYQDVDYAEDQVFGRDILENGYYKAYAPRGVVFHSNEIRISEYRNRIFDEYLGLRKVGIMVEKPSMYATLKLILKGSLLDSFRIIKDPEYKIGAKIRWLFINPIVHIEKWIGMRKALDVDLKDKVAIDRNSLESKQK